MEIADVFFSFLISFLLFNIGHAEEKQKTEGRTGGTLLMIMCECGASCVFKQCLAEGERSYFLLLIFFFPFLSFLSISQPPNLRSLFVKVLFLLGAVPVRDSRRPAKLDRQQVQSQRRSEMSEY